MVRVITPLPPGEDPAIFLTAARQKDEIDRALRASGFRLVERPDESTYLLRVTIGVNQGSRSCGTLNNVRYALRKEGRTAVVAEAKGWTGSCEPNIFDTVSRELRQHIVGMTGENGQ